MLIEETYRRVVASLGAVPASEYRYPDSGEQLEESVFPIEKRPEEHTRWRQMVDRAFGAQRPFSGIALDAGCGLGTHTRALAQTFSFLISIDADPRRVAVAERAAGGDPNLSFFAMPLEHLVLAALDGVLHFIHCVQVLGHVPQVAVTPILDAFFGILAPGGALFLAVPFTNQAFDEYWMVRALGGGQVSSAWTAPDSYDALARAPQKGLLPVRHFSLPSIQSELARAGLVFEAAQPYNWFDKRRADLFVLARKPAHQ
jgi:SAM-dependent methyltransferase